MKVVQDIVKYNSFFGKQTP